MINLFAIPHSAPSGDLAIGFSACVGMVGGQESIVATGGQQNSSNTPGDQTAWLFHSFSMWLVSFRYRATLPKKE